MLFWIRKKRKETSIKNKGTQVGMETKSPKTEVNKKILLHLNKEVAY
jgi:hypothetical protein